MLIKYGAYIAWILICLISLGVALIDGDSALAHGDQAREIAKKEYIKEIEISQDFVYLYGDRKYKIKTRDFLALNLDFNSAPNITIKTPESTKLIYALLICALGIAIIYIILASKARREQKEQKETIILDSKETSEAPISMEPSIEPMKSSVKLSDVAGIKNVKEDIMEIIDCLKNPIKYKNLGIYPPKGALLIGPPGVGKTMIAKAFAGERGIPFFYQSGSSFVHLYVGVGAKRVRDLFDKARAHAPAIIFIDEIDAIGRARGSDSNREWESTLNELLTQMDGFAQQSGIIVIGATNREEVLDPALLRSGRFDRKIHVDLPDLTEREDILRSYLKDRRHDIDIRETAKLCVGFSGANIASLINESAINALRNGRDSIIMQDIMATSNEVLFGKKRKPALNEKQRFSIAVYNASKALARYLLLDDFDKISLTHAQGDANINEFHSKTELMSLIKVCLSGDLGLRINKMDQLGIAKQDLKNATLIARTMCDDYGMGRSLIGGEDAALEILEEAKASQKDFLEFHSSGILKAARILAEKEELKKDELKEILESVDIEIDKNA